MSKDDDDDDISNNKEQPIFTPGWLEMWKMVHNKGLYSA